VLPASPPCSEAAGDALEGDAANKYASFLNVGRGDMRQVQTIYAEPALLKEDFKEIEHGIHEVRRSILQTLTESTFEGSRPRRKR
jgi:hypothetical protein